MTEHPSQGVEGGGFLGIVVGQFEELCRIAPWVQRLSIRRTPAFAREPRTGFPGRGSEGRVILAGQSAVLLGRRFGNIIIRPCERNDRDERG